MVVGGELWWWRWWRFVMAVSRGGAELRCWWWGMSVPFGSFPTKLPLIMAFGSATTDWTEHVIVSP